MIRRFLRTIIRILTAPIRWILRPFRAFRDFINYEPEDAPTAEVFARSVEQPLLLLDHLDDLRRHLIRAALVLAFATIISFAFASRILDLLAQPIGGIEALRAIEVTESIGAFMRVSLMSGFVLAFPYILFELFLFVNPGLRRTERISILVAVPTSLVLFILGMSFAYFIMLPAALPFLLNFMGIQTVPRPSNYIGFVTSLMFWIGLAFQFPLIMYALAAIGLITARTLIESWRIAFVGIAVLSAAITPTVDPVNMGLVMVPMIVLYVLSIGLAAIAERTRTRPNVQQTQQPAGPG